VRCTADHRHGKGEFDQIRARLVERVCPERARRTADYSRNLFIFPNLILISSWYTIGTFCPLAGALGCPRCCGLGR